MNKKNYKQYLSVLYEKFEKCLSPEMNCNKAAIKAHSIQNARILEQLSEDGHIIALQMKPGDDGPILQFAKIGRNLASTFTGLCAEHDADIFREIDQEKFDPRNSRQKFLLAYRAITKELHAAMRASFQLQKAYVRQVGEDNENPQITPLRIEATEQMLVAYDVYQYRERYFDRCFVNHRESRIKSDIIFLPSHAPTLAVSSFFSIPAEKENLDPVRIALNVFPANHDSNVVMFTYSDRDRSKFRRQYKKIFFGSTEQRLLEISKIIIGRTENFVISPRYFNNWSEKKSNTIIHYCRITALGSEIREDDPNLCLFS